jgi:hypothetical protein
VVDQSYSFLADISLRISALADICTKPLPRGCSEAGGTGLVDAVAAPVPGPIGGEGADKTGLRPGETVPQVNVNGDYVSRNIGNRHRPKVTPVAGEQPAPLLESASVNYNEAGCAALGNPTTNMARNKVRGHAALA